LGSALLHMPHERSAKHLGRPSRRSRAARSPALGTAVPRPSIPVDVRNLWRPRLHRRAVRTRRPL